MEKEFIPYTEALALKELGFDENSLAWFLPEIADKGNIPSPILSSYSSNFNSYLDRITAPLWQQAFRFFRNKKYQAEILWRGDFSDFCWKIGNFEYSSHFFSENGFDTYEEAELACLKKLIELAKEQNVK